MWRFSGSYVQVYKSVIQAKAVDTRLPQMLINSASAEKFAGKVSHNGGAVCGRLGVERFAVHVHINKEGNMKPVQD